MSPSNNVINVVIEKLTVAFEKPNVRQVVPIFTYIKSTFLRGNLQNRYIER